MRIRVRLFAALAEGAGTRALDLELPGGTRTVDVRDALMIRYPHLGPLMGRSAFAVNAEYADSEQTLRDLDEVALIPPVSGGK
jgi:molybdopterin synthase catalytic subunit